MEFKNSQVLHHLGVHEDVLVIDNNSFQHFKSVAEVEKPSADEPRSDSVIPEV